MSKVSYVCLCVIGCCKIKDDLTSPYDFCKLLQKSFENKNKIRKTKLKREQLTYKINPNGFTILYSGYPIGNTVINGKMTTAQVEKIKKNANTDIDLIVNGRGSKYWKNLNRILSQGGNNEKNNQKKSL